MKDSFLRRNQKWIWWIIAIPVLVTFSITGTCDQVIGQRGGSSTVASFTLPSGKHVQIHGSDYQRLIANLRMFGGGRDLTQEDVLKFAMLLHAAEDAGVVTTPSQISKTLKAQFQTSERYQQFLKDTQLDSHSFETYLGRALSVGAYQSGLSEVLSVPEGEEVLKKWQEMNEEYKLEFLSFSPADAKKNIDTGSIGDEELQKHLDGLSDPEKNRKFRREGKISIEGLTLKVTSAQDALFEPLLAETKIEDGDLREYHRQNRFYRFKRPEEPKKEGEAADSSVKPPSPFFEFDEIKDRVTREYRLKRALEKLIATAKEESKKDGFSWESFGRPYGLEYFSIVEPKTRSELQNYERFGSVLLPGQAFVLAEGELSEIVGLAADDFFLYRVTKKIPDGVPALSEIRDKVLDDYLEKKSFELAKEKAAAFLAEARPVATAEKPKEGETPVDLFAKLAKEKGHTLDQIDFFSRSVGQRMEHYKEPDSSAKFLKGNYSIFALKAGEISEPIQDTINKQVYLVRVVERRLPETTNVKPRDYEQAKMMWNYDPKSRKDEFSYEALKARFQLQVREEKADG